MRDHDQEDPADQPPSSRPSRPEQPNDKPAKSEASCCEQGTSQIPTRWQRIKQHPAFKTVLAVGIAVVGGAVVLATRSDEEIEQAGTSALKANHESTEVAFADIEGEAIRKSPSEHLVSGHQRSQHYGPGGTETKIVQISPHSRGGTA